MLQQLRPKATEIIGNKIADKLLETKPVLESNFRNVKEIIVPPEHKEEILNELGQVL